MSLERDVPLASLTTLEIGGPARFLARPERSEDLAEILALAAREGLPTFVLGGGSNVLVSDRGYPGLVLVPANTGCAVAEDGERPLIRVGAGEPWDRLVAWTVAEDLAGLECLSGIPGTVGAAPIQNIGAYGQEAGAHIEAVHVLRRSDGAALRLSHEDCDFGYRDSLFKREANGRYVVAAVDFRLTRGGAPSLRYAELNRRFEGATPDLARVRAAVLDIRGGKSMLGSDDDPNRRSAGSFFTNPVVSDAVADDLVARHEGMPRYPAGEGKSKLSAAWLIEHAGFRRGYGAGPAGLSTAHTLCIVNRGGATAADILAFAAHIRDGVLARFDVRLQPEPHFVGFEPFEVHGLA